MLHVFTFFYSAVSCLPVEPLTVTTPIGAEYQGLKFSQKVRFKEDSKRLCIHMY